MKRDLRFGFDYLRRLQKIEQSDSIESPVRQVDVTQKPTDAILKVIYAPDPRTGLPTGDIAYYVSDNVNPQIKQFILQNLMIDISAAKNPPIPEGIDDSLAFDLSRQRLENGRLESLQEYAERLNKFSQDNVSYAKLLADKQRVVDNPPAE